MNTLLLYYQRLEDIDDNLIYKKAAEQQECYVRDVLGHDLCRVSVFSVGHHMSKSVPLHVYAFVMRNGIRVIMRNNFYNWVVSVDSPEKLDSGILPTEFVTAGLDENTVGYAEGFKDDMIFGSYKTNEKNSRFTIQVSNDYKLYTIIWKLKNVPIDVTVKRNSEQEVAEFLKKTYEENKVPTLMSFCDLFPFTFTSLVKAELRDGNNYPLTRDMTEEELAALICRHPETRDEFDIEKSMMETSFRNV